MRRLRYPSERCRPCPALWPALRKHARRCPAPRAPPLTDLLEEAGRGAARQRRLVR